jgi:DNA-binding transcriptional MocR family regulator
VDLPEDVDVHELEALARERALIFVKGSDFLLEGGDSSLRIAYSGVTTDQIEEGVGRLAEAYRDLTGAPA